MQLRAQAEIDFEVESDNDWDSDDGLPLSNFIERRPKNSKTFAYTLNKDLENSFLEWQPIQNVKNNRSPGTTFKIFFDKDLVEEIVNFSNVYSQQKNRTGDITVDEMYCFLGVLLVSGYASVSRRHMYWQNCDDTQNKLISAAISRDRFQFIMSNLHCNDNTTLDKNDKYCKLRPLFNNLNKKFFDFAPIEQNHSFDEAMIPYFGRHTCKQFIRGKPIRWGYKFWVGTLRLGYIVYFDPYQGSSTTISEKYKHMGLGASVVLQYADMLQKMPYQPFHLFFDNFFSSLSLLKELKLRNIQATGTIRENRIPKSPFSNSTFLKKKARGTFEYGVADNEIALCKWNDNSVVTLATNACTVFPVHKVKRFSQSEKKHVSIDQPRLIKAYNENMGGVDRSDQNIGQYRVSIRGKKWYFPLFSHCVDMVVQNSWHLHKNDGGTLDQLQFRRDIGTELLESHKKSTKKGPSKLPKNAHQYTRYDRLDHLVIYQENQRRCAVCHKKANFLCQKCNISLHPKDCFINYHTN